MQYVAAIAAIALTGCVLHSEPVPDDCVSFGYSAKFAACYQDCDGAGSCNEVVVCGPGAYGVMLELCVEVP